MGDVSTGCPSCGVAGEHDILKKNGDMTVKCVYCGHVHKVNLSASPGEVERRVIVSQGSESFPTTVSLNPKENLEVGEERVLECDEGIFGVEITSLESDKKRLSSAEAEDIETIWARSIDNVEVPITIHGEYNSESYTLHVPGDYKFTIGEKEKVDKNEFEVTYIISRDGEKSSYEGDIVLAKNIKRVYGEQL